MARKIIWVSISLAALFVLIYVFTMSMGKPITTDLSIIQQGRPALVLAYQNFSPTGGEALNNLRKIRSEFDSKLDFVIADLGTPEGTAFANRHRLVDGLAIYINEYGEPRDRATIPGDQQALRELLETLLDSET